MKKIVFSLIFLLMIAGVSSAQKLSKTEKKIIDQIVQYDQDSKLFLEKVVNINSGTLNVEGVREVSKMFRVEFNKIGFDTKWIELPDSLKRAGHLFAERKGKMGKRLLLIGHLDTVFERDSPFQTYEVLNDSTAKGPGVADMKGGDVIMLYALRALNDLGLLKNTQIIVALHGDEEEPGKPLSISRKDIIDAGKRSDISLGFEGATGFNYGTIARRGSSGWKLTVHGQRAHSSGIFKDEYGAGAVFEASRILNAFYEEVRGEEYLSFNPGIILGGTFVEYNPGKASGTAFGKTNVIAQTVVVDGGLRFISEEQKENARNKMREIVARNLPKTSAEIEFHDSYPAMQPTEGNMQVLKVLDQISQDMGAGPVEAWDPGERGAGDISFVAKYTDGLDGLGTMGDGGHTPQETANLKTMNTLIQRAALLIYRLTR